MGKWGGIIIGAILLIGGLLYWQQNKSDPDTEGLLVSPRSGNFEVTVAATGELQAKRSVEIRGPDNIRKARIWQLKIQSLLPEGSVVKAGEPVAELDKSELVSKIKEAENNYLKAEAQYTQAKLDCTLTLSQAREDVVNQNFALEENRLKKEQSRFEAPAVVRQTEIEYEKAQRQLKQTKVNYETKVKQAKAKMQEVESELHKQQDEFSDLKSLLKEFTIMAPENGMVIYKRDYSGKKITQGESISSWDPTVATLPDLSEMESVAYINEIDVQKLKEGQDVRISLDADPQKKLTGKITFKANIGEQRPNSESKVFEVRIAINEKDTTLRPAMTTSNQIIISITPNALSIPLECTHTIGKKTYLFRKNNNIIERIPVQIGATNETEAWVRNGISDKELIYLSLPDTSQNKPVPLYVNWVWTLSVLFVAWGGKKQN